MTEPTTDQVTRAATLALDAFRASIELAFQQAVNSCTAVPRFKLTQDHVVGDLHFTTTAELQPASVSVRITCTGTGDPAVFRQLARLMRAPEVMHDDNQCSFVFSNNLDKSLVHGYRQVLNGTMRRFKIGDSGLTTSDDVAVITQPSAPDGSVSDITPYAQFQRPDKPAQAIPPVEPSSSGIVLLMQPSHRLVGA